MSLQTSPLRAQLPGNNDRVGIRSYCGNVDESYRQLDVIFYTTVDGLHEWHLQKHSVALM
jgi:hypothetical protein